MVKLELYWGYISGAIYWGCIGVILGIYWSYIGVILELHWSYY